MLRIGAFSRIAHMTIDTLRHYDAVGLLKPAVIDPTTGYRYYTADQLQVVNQIVTFKELGFSLEEIAHIQKGHPSSADLHALLQHQLRVTEQMIAAAEQRRSRILVHLHAVEAQQRLPPYAIQLKSMDSTMVATIRATVPTMAQIPDYWQAWFETVAAWLHTQQIPIEVPIAFHHDEGFQHEQIDTECGFIIPPIHRRALAPPAPIVLRQLPAHAPIATVAVANPAPHTGGLKDAYTALGQWISTQGYTLYGAPREVYYGSPETGDVTVEIQLPVVPQ